MANDLLTYDNMLKFLQTYFDSLKNIKVKENPKIRETMTDFFASDFEIRWDDMSVKIENREEWINHICGHSNVYIAHVIYKPYPFRIILDDKQKMAACWVKEEMRNAKTNELTRVFLLNNYFEFKVEDNKIKFAKEFISLIAGLYSSDVPPYK